MKKNGVSSTVLYQVIATMLIEVNVRVLECQSATGVLLCGGAVRHNKRKQKKIYEKRYENSD